MKAYICTDLEGVAGVVSFEDQAYPDGKYFENARKLLTGEINAAVDGLIESGVDDILIMDGHGPGALVYEELHPEAKLYHGRPLAPREVLEEYVRNYDFCMMVGQHAMAGTVRGNLNHTQNSRGVEYYKLNGKPIGEIAQFALYQGALGLPMIFLSGDDAGCREAEELIPGIITACVKYSMSRLSAISIAHEKAREIIRTAVKEAVRKHESAPLPPVVWKNPFILEKRYFHTHLADGFVSAHPDAERIDELTVRIQRNDIRDAVYL